MTETEFTENCDLLAKDQKSLEALEQELADEIIRIRERKGPAIEAFKDRIKKRNTAASKFLRSTKGEKYLDGKRSAKTALCEFGLRESTSIVKLSNDWNEAQQCQALIDHGHSNCVRITEKIDKEAAEKLTDPQLAECGLRRSPRVTFWFKPRSEADKTQSTTTTDAA